MLLFHEEKKLKARVRLTSHNILEIANPSRIHSHSWVSKESVVKTHPFSGIEFWPKVVECQVEEKPRKDTVVTVE